MGPQRLLSLCSLLLACFLFTGCRGLAPEAFLADADAARPARTAGSQQTLYVAMSSGDLIAYRVGENGALSQIAHTRPPAMSKLRVALGGELLLIGGSSSAPLYAVKLNKDGTFVGDPYPLVDDVGDAFDVPPSGDLLVVSRLTPIPGKRNGRTTLSIYRLSADSTRENLRPSAERDLPACPNYECIRLFGGVDEHGSRLYLWQDETECSRASCLTYWRRRVYERSTNTLHPFTDSFASGIRMKGVPVSYKLFAYTPGEAYNGTARPSDPYVGLFDPPYPSSQSWTCAPRSGPGWRIAHSGCNVRQLIFDPYSRTLFIANWDFRLWSFPMRGAEPDASASMSVTVERFPRLMVTGDGYLATVEDRMDSSGASSLVIRRVDRNTSALSDPASPPLVVTSYIHAIAAR